ncbi:hypothetical protein H6G33_10465 [Calothrix sp. FACHB-1219]|uniref:hypothetical protein n=1 Tax=unclassified Calothrix TaxID=2619626 RepID=UPI0016873957|nr:MULTISPECIES: hypothetical protein [unclassified Calothrix]MBD2201770.1 hypothetical protein [Calothrix sp. FACHB-168]MBD2217456.1 hypothetical protein [Calothrix sp. FACHB-1219]
MVMEKQIVKSLEELAKLICYSNLKFFSTSNKNLENDVIVVKYQMDYEKEIYLVNKDGIILNYEGTQELLRILMEHFNIPVIKIRTNFHKLGFHSYDLTEYIYLTRPAMLESMKVRKELKNLLEEVGLEKHEIDRLCKSE